MDLLAYGIRHLIAPAWAAWERSPYLRHYRRLLRTQYQPLEQTRDEQWKRLTGLLDHAYRTTPFWRRRFQDLGAEPGDIRDWDDFRKIPLLTKSDLRQRRDEVLSETYRNAPVHHRRTSGSTGVSLHVVVDEAGQQFQRACTLRSDEWSGWRLGQRIAAFWGNSESTTANWRRRLRNALLERITYLDTLKIDEASMERFLAEIRRRPPSLLFGHAHSLFLFADYLWRRGQCDLRPDGIISTAMVLHDWERRVIEDVFRCRVTNRYGCEEVGLIACQCPLHDGLHVNADAIYLEVLRRDGMPAAPGEAGMVVLTDLTNSAMPLIRYQVGDMAVASDRKCDCGRGLPLLERVEGRIADYVVTPAGEWVSGISLTDHFAVKLPGVAQFQIVQEEIDRLVFRIVCDDEFGQASLDLLEELVRQRFGSQMRYECQYVDNIPQEPSGKYRFCISKVAKPALQRG